MADIPAADLPLVEPGAFDTMLGVDESTGAARRFPVGIPAATLASTDTGKGAALVGLESGRTVQDKSTDIPSAKDFGAAGDGVADDTASIAAADAEGDQYYLPAGDYVVTGITNPMGTERLGDGRILKAITGGYQQLNSKADDGQHVFGREYLWAWIQNLRANSAAKVLCSGDSTTEGGGLASPYKFHEFIYRGGLDAGFTIDAQNRGHSGKHTGDWVSTYLASDLAEAPNLYVVRWGINDPFYGRTIDDFATSLRAGLAQCRATYSLSQMSILLCVPNATSDTPNNRDERWYEQVRRVIRQAARDYQCCMIDLYSLFQDARPGAGRWLDDPFGDGRGIHPTISLAMQIGDEVNKVLYPRSIIPRMQIGAGYSPGAGVLPSTYPRGWSFYAGGVAWPIENPGVATFRNADGHALQFVYSSNSASVGSPAANGGLNLPQIAMRFGTTNPSGSVDAWHEWTTSVSVPLTLENSWVNFAADTAPRAKKSNNVVVLDGLVKSGTTTALTTITTLPPGYRPRNSPCIFIVAAGPTGSTTPCQVQVLSTGEVQILAGATTTYVSLNGISFEAGN